MAKKPLSKKEQLKQNRKKRAEELSGIHIYKDDHNRYVYYDVFSKNGYVISNVPGYRNFANRFYIAAGAGALIYTLNIVDWSLLLACIVSIICYLFLEFRFRAYLKKQVMLKNFIPTQRTPRILVMASCEKQKIFLKIFLYIVIAICLALLPYSEPTRFPQGQTILCFILAAIALFMCGKQIYALIYKNKYSIEDRY